MKKYSKQPIRISDEIIDEIMENYSLLPSPYKKNDTTSKTINEKKVEHNLPYSKGQNLIIRLYIYWSGLWPLLFGVAAIAVFIFLLLEMINKLLNL